MFSETVPNDLNLVKEVNLNLDINSMKELVSKIASSYSKDVTKSMVSTTQELTKARFNANEALAKATLRSISTASETYATANNGNYPKSSTDLTSATPPYLNNNYCDQVISGYKYACEFKGDGYKIIATPSSSNSGSTAYTISTGGVMVP